MIYIVDKNAYYSPNFSGKSIYNFNIKWNLDLCRMPIANPKNNNNRV